MKLSDTEIDVVDLVGLNFKVVRVHLFFDQGLRLLFRGAFNGSACSAVESVIDMEFGHRYTRIGMMTNVSPSTLPVTSAGLPPSARANSTGPTGSVPSTSRTYCELNPTSIGSPL